VNNPVETGRSRNPHLFLKLLPWAGAVATGGLLALAFPPFNQAWLAWVAFWPLLAAVWLLPGGSWRNAGLGYVAGLTFFWINLFWITTVSGAGWFAFPFFLALYFVPWSWLAGLLSQRVDVLKSKSNLLFALFLASTWTALEWVRGWLFSGFGWNTVGVSQHDNLPIIQIVEFTGVGGVSFLVMWANVIGVATLRRFFAEVGKTKIRPHYDFTCTMAMVAAVFGFGAKMLLAPETGAWLHVAAVQPNIPIDQKHDPKAAVRNVEILDRLTQTALAMSPELVLWPETSIPTSTEEGTRLGIELVERLMREHDFQFLLGSEDGDEAGSYNAAFLLTGSGAPAQVYRKVHLVPFGEFIPFRHSFPLFAWIAGHQVPGDFVSGKVVAPLHLRAPALAVAPLICFEDTLGDLTRQFVQKGAQVLVNITNDGWFLTSAEPEQHLSTARFRAIENRRPLLRCANTGITTFIDVCGRRRHELRGPGGSHFIEGVLTAKVRVPDANAPQTFYTRHGEVFSMACSGVMILAFVTALRRRRP